MAAYRANCATNSDGLRVLVQHEREIEREIGVVQVLRSAARSEQAVHEIVTVIRAAM
jgi:hypothetical protein